MNPDGTYRESAAWWFHLQVFNPRRWPAVTQVRLNLIQIEQFDAAGTPQTVWRGTAAVIWANADQHPLLRDVGHAADADICSLVKGDCLRIYLRDSPRDVDHVWGGRITQFLTFQASGIEADSPPLRVQIAWDGGWGDDEEQLKKHLVVKVAPRGGGKPA